MGARGTGALTDPIALAGIRPTTDLVAIVDDRLATVEAASA